MSLFFYLRHKNLAKTEAFEKQVNGMFDIAKRYRAIETSDKYKEYLLLETTVTTDFFQTKKKKAMADKDEKKAWLTSEEAKQEARYEELKKDADILFFKQTKEADVKRVEALKEVFVDDFNGKTDVWKPGFVYPNASFLACHSYTNELQANHQGKNANTHDSRLVITTRKEQVSSPAWDEKKGISTHTFRYSSDVLNNGVAMNRDGGLVMVKARTNGKHIRHRIALRTASQMPMLSLMDSHERKLSLGMRSLVAQPGAWMELADYPTTKEFIYTISWNKTEIIWFVNNQVVHRCPNTMPVDAKLYLHIQSFLPKAEKVSEGSLEIDWVRQYSLV